MRSLSKFCRGSAYICGLQVILVIMMKLNYYEENERHNFQVKIRANKWPGMDFKITYNSQLKSYLPHRSEILKVGIRSVSENRVRVTNVGS